MPATARRTPPDSSTPKNQGSLSARNIMKDSGNAKFNCYNKNTSNNEYDAANKQVSTTQNISQEKVPSSSSLQLNNIPKPRLKLKD
jgi:hypothetical protein